MWSETPIHAPKLLHVEKTLTVDEFEKIKCNYETKLKDDKIEQTQPPSWTEKQKEDRKTLMTGMKENLKKVKSWEEVIPILDSVLTELEQK